MIECTFEENLCDWKQTSDDNKYRWYRKSIGALTTNELPGPGVDVNDNSKSFAYTGYKIAGSDSTGTKATLASPEFLVEEHPIECFHFWFYFGVSYNIDMI